MADKDHEEVLMVEVVAIPDAALPPSEGKVEMATKSHAAACSRRRRISELRRAIEAGEYQVPAADLAEALLRSTRSAN
jgi:anti-sigma28 factor (negative regulator of flagellin synthesis)